MPKSWQHVQEGVLNSLLLLFSGKTPRTQLYIFYCEHIKCQILLLPPLQIGEEYRVGRFLVKPFKTYHTVPSQVLHLES